MSEASTKFCPQCGTELPAEAKFCASCGATVEPGQVHDHAVAPASSAGGSTGGSSPSRRSALLWIAGLVVAAIVVGGGIALLGNGGGVSGDVLLAFPNRDGTVDIHVVGLGAETGRDTRVAEDVRLDSPSIRVYRNDYRAYEARDVVVAGGTLFGLYRDEDYTESYLHALEPDGEVVVDFDGSIFSASWDPESERFFIVSGDESPDRCYVVGVDGEAERLGRGDSCQWTLDNSRMVVFDSGSNGVDLTVVDLEGNEYAIVEDEEDYSAFAVDASADHVTVLFRDNDGNTSEAVVFRTVDGERIVDIDDYDSVRVLSSSDASTAFYFVAADEGDEEVRLLRADATGAVEELAEADRFSSLRHLDGGTHLAYTAQEGDDFIVYVQDLATGDRLEVADSDEGTSTMVLPDGRLAAFTRDGGAYVAEADGTNARRIGRIGIAVDSTIGWTAESDDVFFWVWDRETDLRSLFRYDTAADELVELVEEYAQISYVSVSGDGNWLAFGGREDSDDDEAVFLVPVDGSDRPDELDDDADDVVGLDFVGSDLIYSVRTGDRDDDFEVRRLRIGSDERPEVLYEEAYIAGIGNATTIARIAGS